MLPFADCTLAWPRDGALFLRARDGWPLHERPLPGLVCEQGFQPDAQALERSGFDVREPDGSKYPLVLVLPPRQRDEARALFAQALARLQPGGRSEEHTSELQSLMRISYAVFCLKKKNRDSDFVQCVRRQFKPIKLSQTSTC